MKALPSKGMEFFDCNVMIGPTVTPLPGGTLGVQDLLDEMDRLGIERTLFFHYSFDIDAKKEMNRLTLAAARESARLVPTPPGCTCTAGPTSRSTSWTGS